jgi:hypothetical protein
MPDQAACLLGLTKDDRIIIARASHGVMEDVGQRGGGAETPGQANRVDATLWIAAVTNGYETHDFNSKYLFYFFRLSKNTPDLDVFWRVDFESESKFFLSLRASFRFPRTNSLTSSEKKL